jgi:hypothetical protein
MMWSELGPISTAGGTPMARGGHRSVRVGFQPFSYLTHTPAGLKKPTRYPNIENPISQVSSFTGQVEWGRECGFGWVWRVLGFTTHT